MLGDPETMRFYTRPFSRDEVQGWVERTLSRYERDGTALLGLELRTSGELVGDCGPGVMSIDGVDELELGWHVRRDLWGQGLAPEAAIAARDWAFDTLGRGRLVALIATGNAASIRVAEKTGMHLERDLDHHGRRHHLFAMTPTDRDG